MTEFSHPFEKDAKKKKSPVRFFLKVNEGNQDKRLDSSQWVNQ